MNAEPGDLIFLLSGETDKVRKQMNELRLLVAEQLGLRNPKNLPRLGTISLFGMGRR